jgi:hypothetical protein
MHRQHGRRRRGRRLGRLIAVASVGLLYVAGCHRTCANEEEQPPDLPAKPIRVEHLKKELWVVEGGLRDAQATHAD